MRTECKICFNLHNSCEILAVSCERSSPSEVVNNNRAIHAVSGVEPGWKPLHEWLQFWFHVLYSTRQGLTHRLAWALHFFAFHNHPESFLYNLRAAFLWMLCQSTWGRAGLCDARDVGCLGSECCGTCLLCSVAFSVAVCRGLDDRTAISHDPFWFLQFQPEQAATLSSTLPRNSLINGERE